MDREETNQPIRPVEENNMLAKRSTRVALAIAIAVVAVATATFFALTVTRRSAAIGLGISQQTLSHPFKFTGPGR